MKHGDVEELARKAGLLVVTLEPGAGYNPIRMIQPVSSTNVAVELSKFAALVLEKAADVIRDECLSGNQAENELRAMSAALQSGDSSGGVK